jgi:UDP-2,3-diacylglucosamine hydrolase
VPTLVSAGRGVYGNAGAWYLDHQFLVIDDDAISRRQWSASGHVEEIESLTRPV